MPNTYRRQASGAGGERGFTLIETLVATTIMTVAILSMAQLLAVSMRANQDADAIGVGVMLAQQKLEQLRGLTWGIDSTGLPLSDTTSDVTVIPERPDGGFGLSPSPSRSLQHNTSGYCDFLDAHGQPIAAGTSPPPGTAYIRRWAIDALTASPNDSVVLQVLVTRWRTRGTADSDQADEAHWRLSGEARLVTLKTRKVD